jgi:hypothetical protein
MACEIPKPYCSAICPASLAVVANVLNLFCFQVSPSTCLQFCASANKVPSALVSESLSLCAVRSQRVVLARFHSLCKQSAYGAHPTRATTLLFCRGEAIIFEPFLLLPRLSFEVFVSVVGRRIYGMVRYE